MKQALTCLIFSFILLFHTFAFSQEVIKEAKIKFDLPNDSWMFIEKQQANFKKLYTYKREPIKNKSGQNVTPNISFMTQKVDKDQDVIMYSASRRMVLPIEIDDVFIYEDGLIGFENAIGYKGRYEDKYGEHTVYLIHLINNNRAVEVIMDVTSDVFDKVDEEFKVTMKSIAEN